MRMTNRLSKWSRHSSRMICLMAACGLMYACKDEYTLDDEMPGWLNTSIYESLEKSGNFKTYLRLLADKDVNPANARPLTEELSKTGSKTVFVADDAAWEAFFKKNEKLPESNPWHYATSYENLSVAQKKLLIHTSMLNNAIVMENLASSEASGENPPTRGEYMRRFTDVAATDTITYIKSEDLPVDYNPVDKDYWYRFRKENGGNGIYLVTDSSLTMMLHFTQEHMSRNNINSDFDFPKFFGRERITSDVHIYDAHLDSTDIVCQNGYVNMTEKPLCPLASMAEVIRTNGKTNIFSHMLDRYCAPFYNHRITTDYKVLHPDFTDSIFTKRYFSDMSAGGRPLASEPGDRGGTYKNYYPFKYTSDAMPADLKDYAGAGDVSLKYDPAWNEYYEDRQHPENREKDMAAMFVPSDSTLWNYFINAGGKQLIKTYYQREGTKNEIPYSDPTTYEELYKQIDCVPLPTLQKLINIIMLRSFVGSVPSKMTKQKDDALEQLFYPEDIDKIDTCLMASNGAVYIMNQVYGPADFTSVTAPAFISTTNKIMNWAIYDQNNMGLNYYAYLKAMQSRFTFFMPSDAGLLYYYDPTSMKSRNPRVVQMKYKPVASGQIAVSADCFKYIDPYGTNYDPKNPLPTGSMGDVLRTADIEPSDIINRLKDILESHTIVHDGTNPIDGEDEYFLSKNGNAIKVVRDENNNIIAAKGGFQLENERQGFVGNGLNKGVTQCEVTAPFPNLKNGSTYVLDSPMVPTYRSVWSILTDDMLDAKYNPKGYSEAAWAANPYSAFYDLCDANNYDTEIMGCGLVNSKAQVTEQNAAKKKFYIFCEDKGLDYNIQFFNNYRYTVFVPTNEAIHEAIANGLPTWEEIYKDYHSHCKHEIDSETGAWVKDAQTGEYVYTNELETYEDSIRIAAKITYLTNFIRYHFADNSVFADKSELSDANGEMVTSSYDHETGLFCKIHVDRVKQGDETVLRVCDDVTYKKDHNNKISAVKELTNILARDISCSKKGGTTKEGSPRGVAMKNIVLDASSAAVIHQINGVLNHTALVGGRHDSAWSTTANAKKYLKRYAIKAIK